MKSYRITMNTLLIMIQAISIIGINVRIKNIETALIKPADSSSATIREPSASTRVSESGANMTRTLSKRSLFEDFRAICLWENRGVIRDSTNEKEGAVGPAQIRKCYLQDANEWLVSHELQTYSIDDMHDYNKSFAVFCAYMSRYGAKTTEERARIHNGGPNGCKIKATDAYWVGVQSYIGK